MKSANKILCLVNLPNGTTFGIQCDPKAIGQNCIEEVCKNLGFTCETDYFGLVECSKEPRENNVPNNQPKHYDWINLRNPLGQHGTAGQPYSLAFRVKFWVPAHLILQDSVRNIFYMQARVDLLESRLRAVDWECAAKLGALLAQADEVKFDPNSLTVVNDDTSSNSINNSIESNKSNVTTSDNPNTSNKESLRKSKKRKLSKRRSSVSDDDDDIENTPVIQEIYNPLRVYEDYVIQIEDTTGEIPQNFVRQIACEHKKLTKMSSKSAKYWLLETIFKLPRFGEEVFSGITVPSGTTINANGVTVSSHHDTQRCDISVGPHGLLISTQNELTRIPFSAASSATPFKRNFRLVYVTEENQPEEIELKLARPRNAVALYRAITEKHAFYSCETVGSDVTKQFIRDFKGTIASMFNVHTKLGKLYVFDIQHTYREVYDHARRILHARGVNIAAARSTDATDLESSECSLLPLDFTLGSSINSAASLSKEVIEKMEKEVAERISEAITCRICMDREIDTSFSPCGHITSCSSCAKKCETCPLCRAKITSVNKVFLPTELRTTASTIAAPAT